MVYVTRHNDSMTATDDLIPWLPAQVDEDERVANEMGELDSTARNGIESTAGYGALQLVDRFDRERLLREVEAKRRILARHAPMSGGACNWCWGNDGKATWPCADVRDVAAVYVDRPGYQEEWRP